MLEAAGCLAVNAKGVGRMSALGIFMQTASHDSSTGNHARSSWLLGCECKGGGENVCIVHIHAEVDR